MIKDQITQALKTALGKIGLETDAIAITSPSNTTFGDYTTNIALQLAKTVKKNPFALAEEIAQAIDTTGVIMKAEAYKPGFVNIWVNQQVLQTYLQEILKDTITVPEYHLGAQKKIMFEFAHPNTHKLFHIGHLRNISTGETMVRLYEAVGNKTISVNYQGDVGMHIAKCLWRLKQMFSEDATLDIKNLPLREKIELLGKAYSQGSAAFESDEKAKQEIIDTNKKIYTQDPEIKQIWEETRGWSLEYFDEIYKLVGTKFDRLYFESEFADRGLEIAHQAVTDGILEKSDGAIILNGEKHGVHTRVFVNSQGFPTYEGKEIALAETEFKEFGELDKNIHVLGGEQQSFFKTAVKAQELIDPSIVGKQYHLIYGWVDVKGQKMSSRKGNIVEAEWLINEAKKAIIAEYESSEEVAQALAIAAIKYAFLKNGILTSVMFDLSDAINLHGDSGPYLLYTYVRAKSVLAKEAKPEVSTAEYKPNDDELQIMRKLIKFPDIVLEAAKQFAPNYLTSYLYDLAQLFNLFYQNNPILKSSDAEKAFRLELTQAVTMIMKKGLYLLGIPTVEKM
ncbi:MAG: arginine--tRNA ligase [Weeksellaceae bacterium]